MKREECAALFGDKKVITDLTHSIIQRMQYDVSYNYRCSTQEIIDIPNVLVKREKADIWFEERANAEEVIFDEDDTNYIYQILIHVLALIEMGGPAEYLTPTACELFRQMLGSCWEVDMTLEKRGKWSPGEETAYDFDSRVHNWDVLPPYIRALENEFAELIDLIQIEETEA